MKELELLEKRKEYEKHFLQPDGTIIAKIYDQPIHCLKNGKYEEIDNSLVKTNKGYANKCNSFKVEFDDEYLTKVEKDNDYLYFKIKDYNRKSIGKKIIDENKIGNNIILENIYDNINIKYSLFSKKIKESIIINSKTSKSHEYIFEIYTSYDLLLMKNNSILVKKNSETKFIIEPPIAIDSNQSICNNIKCLLQKDDKYILKIIIDNEWISSDERVYPIIIDPTITEYTSNTSVFDTYIYPNDDLIDRNSQDVLKAGVERINNSDRINRTLIKFNLPDIGTGSQVISANLKLTGYITNPLTFSDDTMVIHKLTEDWDETTATWSQMNNKYDNHIESCFTSERTWNIYNNVIQYSINQANITNLVRRWYTDTPNYGLMVKSNKEIYRNNFIQEYYSKNNSFNNGFNPKPLLEIKYRNQNGLEEYMKYYEQDLECGKIYSNLYNGNLVGLFQVGKTFAHQFPIDLFLVYNTNDVILEKDYGFGIGYKLNYYQTIVERTIDETVYLEYVDDDGTIHYFENKKEVIDDEGNLTDISEINTYYDEDGLEMKIYKTNNTYILETQDKYVYKFNQLGNIAYLFEINSPSNEKIIITYDSSNRITKIEDLLNNSIDICYSDNISIISQDQTVVLNYNSGNIQSITSNSNVTLINYNENNCISQITDYNNLIYKYYYYDEKPYKIQKIQECGVNNGIGKEISLNYNFSSTSLTDENGKTTTMTFSNLGTLLSKTNLKSGEMVKDAYGVSEVYGNYFQYKNKNTYKEMPIKYINNLLSNTSFEENTIIFNAENGINALICNEYSNSGYKSLKITSSVANKKLTKSISVSKGYYYTFSVFIKNTEPVDIILSYINELNERIEEKTSIIEENSDFTRYCVSIMYPLTAQSDLSIEIKNLNTSVSYIDDIQLEIGPIMNNYNYIENSNFQNGLGDWILSAIDYETGNSLNPNNIFSLVEVNENLNAIKIKMDPSYGTSFEKDFNIKGKAGDSYTISFWYKNEGVVPNDEEYNNNVIIKYLPENTNEGYCIFPSDTLNVNEDQWQYFSTSFFAEENFVSLNLTFFQDFNANNLYITNISLNKDIRYYSNNFDYSGNVISQTDLNNESTEFSYNNSNQIVSVKNPLDKTVIIEYDSNNKDSVINQIDECNNNIYIRYDDFKNPNITINNRFEYSLLPNFFYNIRLKGTNKYLKLINKNVIFKEEKYNFDNWVFELINDNVYKIKHSIINKYINTINGIIVLSNQSDNSKFIIEQLNDYSYIIKDFFTNKYLKVSNDNIILSTLEENDNNFYFYIESPREKSFLEQDNFYNTTGQFVKETINQNFIKEQYDLDETKGLIINKTTENRTPIHFGYNIKNQKNLFKNIDIEITYNYVNNKLSQIVLGDKTITLTYDEFLNKTGLSLNNCLIKNYLYYPNDNELHKIAYGNAQEITFDYDDFSRISKISKYDDNYYYFYDGTGSVEKIMSNDLTINLKYDESARPIEEKVNNFIIKYHYDKCENVVNKTILFDNDILSIHNSFNDNNQIIGISIDNSIYNFEYDLLGRLYNKKINDNIISSYSYKKNGKRGTLLIETIVSPLGVLEYKYNSLGKIICEKANNSIVKKYVYDKYGQLIKVIDYINNNNTIYKYDKYGNVLKMVKYSLIDYNIIDYKIFKYDSLVTDVLTKINNEEVLYDEIFNPIKIGSDTYLTWINGKELSNYRNQSLNISYKYDFEGKRIAKTVNNNKIEYYWINDELILETNGQNVLYFIRDEANELIGLRYNNDIYYYIKSATEDIIGLLDSNLHVVAKYEYDSWGNIISIKDSNGISITDVNHIAFINPFRYKSYYYDTETGLYYLKNRYFNPKWYRFLNIDDDEFIDNDSNNHIEYNLFAYCNNDPINLIDDEGNFGELALAGGGTIAVGGSSGAGIALAVNPWLLVAGAVAIGGIYLYSEHRKNKRKSTKQKHEKGQRAKIKQKHGGEKADVRRNRLHQPTKHKTSSKTSKNLKRLQKISKRR